LDAISAPKRGAWQKCGEVIVTIRGNREEVIFAAERLEWADSQTITGAKLFGSFWLQKEREISNESAALSLVLSLSHLTKKVQKGNQRTSFGAKNRCKLRPYFFRS